MRPIPATQDVQRVDMLAMPFGPASFDFVIANHVLEHVDDDLMALAEIHRVLRPGGLAILQTPYCEGLARTWSDPAVVQPGQRLQAYGQEDHVRLYGNDIFERFTQAGMCSLVVMHAHLLPGCDPVRMGVNEREPFFLFERRNDQRTSGMP